MRRRILVADDDEPTRLLLAGWLRDESEVFQAGDADEAVRLLVQEVPDIALTDVVMPGGGARRLLEEARRYLPGCAVVAMSGAARPADFVELFRNGVADFLAKPFSRDELQRSLARALRVRARRDELSRVLPQDAHADGDPFAPMVGRSEPWLTALRQLRAAASADAGVLIVGPTGSGTALAASCLHAASARRDGPLVRVACAALPPSLLEVELFGHSAGAFTGASRARTGRFEEARGGTLVLSRIEAIPMEAQARLLRALESNAIQRVGESEERIVDVRIVATASRDPIAEAAAGRMRTDLAHRLDRLRVTLPALAERGDDLLLLAASFLAEAARRQQRAPQVLSPAAVQALRAHGWPGNVRELANVLERAVIRSGQDEVIEARHVTFARVGGPSLDPADWPLPEDGLDLPALRAEIERDLVAQAMERAAGHHAKAAGLLRIGRSSLERKLQGRSGREEGGGGAPGRA